MKAAAQRQHALLQRLPGFTAATVSPLLLAGWPGGYTSRCTAAVTLLPLLTVLHGTGDGAASPSLFGDMVRDMEVTWPGDMD